MFNLLFIFSGSRRKKWFNINCICNTSKFRLYWKTQHKQGK
ncbi:hypothetical protein ECAI27_13720 [Escherichia coli AI27]|nr:hypothetical protein ECAI27_13720 [Escherichia coli AI27]